MKSIFLIALAGMLIIANIEARPNCDGEHAYECAVWLEGKVRSYCSTQKGCQLLKHPCASEL